MGDFWDAWWQQTNQVKSIVLGNVRMLRTTYTMQIYLLSLLPPSVPKSPIDRTTKRWQNNTLTKFDRGLSMFCFSDMSYLFEMVHFSGPVCEITAR